MELQFEKTALACLRQVVSDVHNEEQTQELKLNESMPDVGKTLGAWGQVLIRGKEWRSGGVSVSGGVMAWVLYAPEDGSEPRCVETWLPFQMRWDLPDAVADGHICIHGLLSGIDARVLSARKLMVRAGISVLCQALVPEQAQVCVPGQVPEDVQMLTHTYPVCLAVEAGEKVFSLDEELTLPASAPAVEQIIRYQIQPELVDRKVVEDKVVFRGEALLHLLYRGVDGRLNCWDFRVPFSQYAGLGREYGESAWVQVVCALTGMELEKDEDRLRFKADLTGQYVIYDRPLVCLVEDAYSLRRAVTLQPSALEISQILDRCSRTVRMEQSMQLPGLQVVDAAVCMRHPAVSTQPEGLELGMQGQWQLLGYDNTGAIQGANGRCELREPLRCAEGGKADALLFPSGWPRAEVSGENISCQADILLEASVQTKQGIPMVSGMTLGELTQPDPGRPSLILRRAGEQRLWDVAKAAGSTVEAIRAANALEGEPAPERLLLIPIA